MMHLFPKPSHLDYVFTIFHPYVRQENTKLGSQKDKQNMFCLNSVTSSLYIHYYLWSLVSCMPGSHWGTWCLQAPAPTYAGVWLRKVVPWSLHIDDALPPLTSDAVHCNSLEDNQGWLLERCFCPHPQREHSRQFHTEGVEHEVTRTDCSSVLLVVTLAPHCAKTTSWSCSCENEEIAV